MQERWMGNARVVREECKWQIRSAREADKKCKSGGWEMQEWLERSASGRLGVHERQVRNARAVDGECKSG